jgi:hypothetical protein
MQRQGDRVVGTTLRTDFDLEKAKQLINQLTGKDLPETATVVDCVRAVSFISAEDDVFGKTSRALVDVLEAVQGSRIAYKTKPWSEMRLDVNRREELYDFDAKANRIINDLKDYVLSGEHTQIEIQKAVVASFLDLSKYFLVDKKIHYRDIRPEACDAIAMDTMRVITYGRIMEEVQRFPGCAGGGGSVTSVTSIIERSGLVMSDNMASLIKSGEDYDFDHTGECISCHKEPTLLGPCDICVSCDAQMGGKAAKKIV